MKQSLRFKIMVAMVCTTLFGIFLTSFTIFFGVENNFNIYIEQNREQRIAQLEQEAIDSYDENGEIVSDQMRSIVREHAMVENIFYHIYDPEGKELLNSFMMHGMMHRHGMHEQDYSPQTSEYQVETIDLHSNGHVLGSIEIFYPVELAGPEMNFLTTTRRNILIAAFITVLLSFLFSMFFSNSISKGFQQLESAIQHLRLRREKQLIHVNSLTKEMQPLGDAFNQLVKTLEKEESLRKHFTADLAHELRTPLATLRSQIEAYQDGVWEPTRERLTQSHNELMRLVRLVNELEKLIAAENPQVHLVKVDINANEIIEEIVHQFASAFYEKGVKLHGRTACEPAVFHADRDKVIQILTNIINNSLLYTPAQRSVTIQVEKKEDMIGFVIEDEGIGIKEEDIPHLFERFYRGDKSRARHTGGIGVGLAIVKALVDAHEGLIEVSSQLNKGTTVKVFFRKGKGTTRNSSK